jgi:L,D-transpeptidase ErfK/SrfK
MRTGLMALVIGVAVAAGVSAQPVIGEQRLVTVAPGDTLSKLGSRFGIDAVTIARDNARSPDDPLRVGEALRLDNRHIAPAFPAGQTVIINLPQRMLFVAGEHGVTAYPVAVGRSDWPTPLGGFSIVSREVNPTWDVPESIREEARRAGRSLPRQVPPGPKNPLGAYWLGLSLGSIGIHGTNAPTSIYDVITHGCIRLHPDDIAALFPQVQVGRTGAVLYQPILIAVGGDDIFVEAHRDVYRRGPADALEFVRSQARQLGVFDRVDWSVAAQVIRERAGIARVVTLH